MKTNSTLNIGGSMQKYTAIIIGGGPSGHSAAVRIAQLGGRVALVEKDYIGGICTNWGCTPSKSMIESAKVGRIVKDAGKYGIDVPAYEVDFIKVAARRDEVILNTRNFITDLLNHSKVEIFQGEADIIDTATIKVRGGKLDADGFTMHYDGKENLLKTENIILATGSAPLIPTFVKLNDPTVVSSNRLISIDHLPKSLTIIGGGVIGIEFATIFSNLGSQVTIVEYLDRVLALMDVDISVEITHLMQKNGVKIFTNHEVQYVGDGITRAKNRSDGEMLEIKADAILVAIGRRPVQEKAGYQRIGLDFNEKGLTINEFQQTNVPGVWAIGDATGRSILAHVGIQQGIICAENIMIKNSSFRKMDYGTIPAVVYSIPEIVMVGIVPKEVSEVLVIKVPFSANLRAGIESYPEGFIKLWIKQNCILAAQVIGHNASEFMQEITNMIALKTPIDQVAEIIHAHPTYSEIVRSTLDFALGKAVDFYL
jgi:dihydrolipoamide dehydrogenase